MKATVGNSVFINCPFDDAYQELFRAIVFTLLRCGYYPRCSLETYNALQNRIDKIVALVKDCKYGIHDLSRVELNPQNLPRFNMPFELGLFYGAMRYGSGAQRMKHALLLEKTKYTYQQFISDLSGVDTKAHENNYETIIDHVRDWLRVVSKRNTVPGHTIILAEYQAFRDYLPFMAKSSGIKPDHIQFADLCVLAMKFIKKSHTP